MMRDQAHVLSLRSRDLLIMAGLMLAVTALSLTVLSHGSLRLDEAQSLWQTSRSPAAILDLVARDVHVPLYHLTLHGWRALVGDGVETARMLSLTLFLLTIPAVYALGSRAYSRSVGLFSAIMFAISPFMNWYANEIRMYTLFTLLVTLNQYAYISLFALRNSRMWFLYGVTALLGVFAHYFFFLNLAAQALFFFLNSSRFPEKSLRAFITVAFFIALAFVPWLMMIFASGDVVFQQPLLPPPTTVNIFNAFSEFLFGFQPDTLNTTIVSLWPVILLVLGFFSLRKESWLTPAGSYLLLTFVFSITAAFVISVFVRPLFVSRYLIFVIPSLYILISAIISVYPPAIARVARILIVVLMLLGLVLTVAAGTNPIVEDYRDMAAYLSRRAEASDIIFISPPFTLYPIEYYYDGSAPIQTLPVWNRYIQGPIPAFNPETLPEEVAAQSAGYERLWIVLSYDQGYEEEMRQYFEQNYERLERVTFPADIEVALYKLRYDPELAPPVEVQ